MVPTHIAVPAISTKPPKIVKIQSLQNDSQVAQPNGEVKTKQDLPQDANTISGDLISSRLDDICVTADCVKASHGLLMNLDESVNPCDNFYTFACGSFEKNAFIPDDKPEITVIGSLTGKLHHQIRMIIENIPDGERVPRSSRLVKNLYDSCKNMGKKKL